MKLEHKSDWKRIFELSKIYGSDNRQDMLPSNPIPTPRATWFQIRLEKIRNEKRVEHERE